jgi:hypothetical protein
MSVGFARNNVIVEKDDGLTWVTLNRPDHQRPE